MEQTAIAGKDDFVLPQIELPTMEHIANPDSKDFWFYLSGVTPLQTHTHHGVQISPLDHFIVSHWMKASMTTLYL